MGLEFGRRRSLDSGGRGPEGLDRGEVSVDMVWDKVANVPFNRNNKKDIRRRVSLEFGPRGPEGLSQGEVHDKDGWKGAANVPSSLDIREDMENEADKINKLLASIDDSGLDTPDVDGSTPDLSNETPNIVDKKY